MRVQALSSLCFQAMEYRGDRGQGDPSDMPETAPSSSEEDAQIAQGLDQWKDLVRHVDLCAAVCRAVPPSTDIKEIATLTVANLELSTTHAVARLLALLFLRSTPTGVIPLNGDWSSSVLQLAMQKMLGYDDESCSWGEGGGAVFRIV